MARIRSTHPGQWKDEDFVECSFAARLLALALRNEADDQGIFEWKPKQIKMACFPADSVDIDALLSEIECANIVRAYEIDGRKYGAIRNFRKYQRPKTPNAVHPVTDEIRKYILLTKSDFGNQQASRNSISEIEEAETPPVPPKGEPLPKSTEQMEEEGGRRKEEGGNPEPNGSGGGAANGHGKPAWWPQRDRYGRVISEPNDKVAYDVGKAVLGKNAGGQITRLRKAYRGDWRAIIELLLRADDTSDPRSWLAAALKRAEQDEPLDPMHVVYPEHSYS